MFDKSKKSVSMFSTRPMNWGFPALSQCCWGMNVNIWRKFPLMRSFVIEEKVALLFKRCKRYFFVGLRDSKFDCSSWWRVEMATLRLYLHADMKRRTGCLTKVNRKYFSRFSGKSLTLWYLWWCLNPSAFSIDCPAHFGMCRKIALCLGRNKLTLFEI